MPFTHPRNACQGVEQQAILKSPSVGTSSAVFIGGRRSKVLENSKQGRLIRQVPVRLMDASLSGCLVESDEALRVGASGTLHVDLWGVSCRYPVRVTRVVERPDTSHTVRIAGEFDWRGTGESNDGSLAKVLKLDRPGPGSRV